MKKLVSIILAIALILSFCVSAFAAQTENTTLIIENSNGRTFTGYKLLNVTTSVKAGDTCENDHSANCYTYAYTVNTDNDAYLPILQSVVAAEGTDPADVTEQQILDYLAAQTGDNSTDTLREVADEIYKAILAADPKVSPEATNLTGTTTIEQGYWLFADTTDFESTNNANSLVIVNTKGLEEITITPKTDLPTVEKKVKDINDTTDASIDDNAWQDAADHNLNDEVPFKLTATLPSNVLKYDNYEIIFHDTLSSGLTYKNNSLAVYMYDSKADADADLEMTAFAADVTDAFTLTTAAGENALNITVACDDILEIDDVTADTVFVVYYKATLNDTANIGSAGNPNKVYLEFSNDPYTDSTGKTPEDKVTVYTYQLNIDKKDDDNNALPGAGFTLYKKDTNGTYQPVGGELGGEDSMMTTFSWKFLDDGDYKLAETTIPEGYNALEDILFTITADHTIVSETEPELTALDGGEMGTGVVSTGLISKIVVNHTGTVLPSTGAEGTMWLILGGTTLVALAAVFMIVRKKMSVYED